MRHCRGARGADDAPVVREQELLSEREVQQRSPVVSNSNRDEPTT